MTDYAAEALDRIRRADEHMKEYRQRAPLSRRGGLTADAVALYAKHERSVAHIYAVLATGQPLEALEQIEGRGAGLEQAQPLPVADGSEAESQDPMPVFVIKAKDEFALAAVRAYRGLCDEHGLHDQAREVGKAHREMREWRERHRDQVKLPDHPHVPIAATGTPTTEGQERSEERERG